ncbi:protein kinase [Streptomyces mirabilis]|nr:protein kinase [Streptomyces mirabilis]
MVTVHDVVVHEGLPWIVMEYVPDAVDLQAVVRQSGPLSPARAARIGLAVLDALSAGHRIGILHRDVKPANILLAPDSSGDPYARVLLTDYGIALQPESREPRLTATAGILGTPGYLAPSAPAASRPPRPRTSSPSAPRCTPPSRAVALRPAGSVRDFDGLARRGTHPTRPSG